MSGPPTITPTAKRGDAPIREAYAAGEMLWPGPLPECSDPPVVETVLGVQFARLPDLSTPLLTQFCYETAARADGAGDWKLPPTEAGEIPPQFEQFGVAPPWGPLAWRLEVGDHLGRRLRLANVEGDRLVQVQNGRVDLNWRRADGGAYPRYRTVRPEINDLSERFRAFAQDRAGADPKPNQWEATYVNHLPRGTVWETASDWRDLFPPLPLPAADLVPGISLESFGGEWHYELTPDGADRPIGRLHVRLQHQAGSDADVPRLVMTLTARGPADSWDAAVQGLDGGREAIVRSFFALTSPAAHQYWGRR